MKQVKRGREFELSSSSGNVYCAVFVEIPKKTNPEEKKNTTSWISRCFQTLHTVIPILACLEDVGGLLLMRIPSKCEEMCILRVFEYFLWWEVFWKVKKVLLMQNLTILSLLCIVYGCSIADANSEVSESGMNQFSALPALSLASPYPRLLWRHRRIIVNEIFE